MDPSHTLGWLLGKEVAGPRWVRANIGRVKQLDYQESTRFFPSLMICLEVVDFYMNNHIHLNILVFLNSPGFDVKFHDQACTLKEHRNIFCSMQPTH